MTAIQHYSNLTIEAIQQDLVTYGPLTVGIYANSFNFMFAGSSGVINSCTSAPINHVVLLIGYDSSYWYIKNSWGTNWGTLDMLTFLKPVTVTLNHG